MTSRTLFAALALAALPLAAAPAAHADKPPIYTGWGSDVAVEGYDPVAYFTEGQPVKGSKDFSTSYKGAEWRFASQANLDAFLADPDAYAPQYGGYCAWAVAQGNTAKGDAEYWTIVDGKLYLNYNKSIQKKWEKDIPGFIEEANANWPSVLD